MDIQETPGPSLSSTPPPPPPLPGLNSRGVSDTEACLQAGRHKHKQHLRQEGSSESLPSAEVCGPFLSSESKAHNGSVLLPTVRGPTGMTPALPPGLLPPSRWSLRKSCSCVCSCGGFEGLGAPALAPGFPGTLRFGLHTRSQEANPSPVHPPPRWLPRFPPPYNHTEIPQSTLIKPLK